MTTEGQTPLRRVVAASMIGTTTALDLGSALANTGAFLLLGFAPDNTPLFGIDVLVQPGSTAFQPTSSGGTASWPLSIPNDPALDNIYLFAQAIVFDTGAPGGLLAASRGMRFRTNRW